MRRIRIRKSSGWKDSNYICLSISCGKRYHDNENFLAALDVAKQSGKPVIIDLSDSLQRYNFMACGLSSEQAHCLANRQGNAWIELHAAHLKGLKILRWDYWLKHPDFCSVHNQINLISKTDKILQQALTLGHL